MLLLSRSGAMKLSATVFRLTGLGFSGLVLFSKRVKVRGSFTKGRKHKNRSLNHSIKYDLLCSSEQVLAVSIFLFLEDSRFLFAVIDAE